MADRFQGPIVMAATASTGNNTHTAVEIPNTYSSAQAYEQAPALTGGAVQLVVEVAGGTPTVTFTVSGSLDGTNFYPISYFTDATDTAAVAAITSTAVGAKVLFLNTGTTGKPRRYKYLRVVTSANTNITYRVELYLFPQNV